MPAAPLWRKANATEPQGQERLRVQGSPGPQPRPKRKSEKYHPNQVGHCPSGVVTFLVGSLRSVVAATRLGRSSPCVRRLLKV